METIAEDYVSFEIAKLLREKGFDEPCNAYFNFIPDNKITLLSNKYNFNNHGFYSSAPTLQMVMKWLREVHNLYIQTEITTWPQKGYFVKIYLYNSRYNNFEEVSFVEHKKSYEQACETAIKYCLEILI